MIRAWLARRRWARVQITDPTVVGCLAGIAATVARAEQRSRQA